MFHVDPTFLFIESEVIAGWNELIFPLTRTVNLTLNFYTLLCNVRYTFTEDQQLAMEKLVRWCRMHATSKTSKKLVFLSAKLINTTSKQIDEVFYQSKVEMSEPFVI